MKAVLQRVKKAVLFADGKKKSKIKNGLIVLLGVDPNDTEKDVDYIVKKVSKIRIFVGPSGKKELSVQDIKGEILLVSNFTLLADPNSANRPSYSNAARPEIAVPLYEYAIKKLSETIPTKTGKFGSHMEIKSHLDGPVTILLDSHITK